MSDDRATGRGAPGRPPAKSTRDALPSQASTGSLAGLSPGKGAALTVSREKLHSAWVVLGAVIVIMLLASGLRAVFGVFIKPMEATFGWDRASLSGAAALSLLLLGAVGPVVG